jgi:hypothetical protein
VSEEAALAFAQSLGSVWSLELLVLLKTDPEKRWRVDELERELRASVQIVGEALQVLARLGIAAEEPPGTWRYTPQSAAVDAVADELLRLYAVKPATVIKSIYASSVERMRGFASAFKIRD